MNIDDILNTIHVEINNLLNNNDFNISYFYTYMYESCLQIQKHKSYDSRQLTINSYKNIFNTLDNIIIIFNDKISNNIKDKEDILDYYYEQTNLYVKNIAIINNTFSYINKELSILDSSYTIIDYNKYGIENWFNSIIFKNIELFNTIFIKYLDFDIQQTDRPIYLLNEFLDTIFMCIHKKIIDSTFFDIHIGDVLLEHIDQCCIDFSRKSYGSINVLVTMIDKFNIFYMTTFDILNLECLKKKYISLLKKRILYKFSDRMKIEYDSILLHPIQNTNLYDDIKLLTKIINYCNDTQYIKLKINDYFNTLYNSLSNFNDILEVFYLTHMIYDECMNIEFIVYYNYDIIVPKNIFEDVESISDNYDKYIRNVLYKKIKKPYFYSSLLLYFKKFKDNELIPIYYKNNLVKRLYKYNFNLTYINIEINIINQICNYWKSNSHSILYKLKKIKTDLEESIITSNEFNSIYDIPSTIILATDGIWNIDPYNKPFSSPVFNKEYNSLIEYFTTFYNCKYNTKKLDWNQELSSCILNYYVNDSMTIEITCPLKIANILYKFNINNSIVLNKPYSKLLEHYNIIDTVDSNICTLNTTIPSSNVVIKFLKAKKKDISKSQKKEIVFTKHVLIEAYCVRLLKNKKSMIDSVLIGLIKEKYKVDNTLITKTIDKLVENLYIKYENSKYMYLD
jgi:hypothetical protein